MKCIGNEIKYNFNAEIQDALTLINLAIYIAEILIMLKNLFKRQVQKKERATLRMKGKDWFLYI